MRLLTLTYSACGNKLKDNTRKKIIIFIYLTCSHSVSMDLFLKITEKLLTIHERVTFAYPNLLNLLGDSKTKTFLENRIFPIFLILLNSSKSSPAAHFSL